MVIISLGPGGPRGIPGRVIIKRLSLNNNSMTLMEKKNEMDLRAYVRPESEIMVINFGRICQIEEGSAGEQDEPWDE